MGEKRKDSKGRILKEGERQRGNFYEFRYSVHGIRKNFYASTLDELREKEKELIKDQLDGTRANARNITLNNLYDIWRKNKKGLNGESGCFRVQVQKETEGKIRNEGSKNNEKKTDNENAKQSKENSGGETNPA